MKVGEIVFNRAETQPGYYRVGFYVPEIVGIACAGQFVHVLIEEGGAQILRRPFSIFNTDPASGVLSVVYKVVGKGTARLAELQPGAVCDLMGPLGNPYTIPADDEMPILVDGGYGAAATFLLAKHAKTRGVLLLGARSTADILLTDDYAKCGFDVRLATNDGSLGHKGFVTELLPPLLAELRARNAKFRIYACGPQPMLLALAKTMQQQNLPGEVSLDHLMCCGIGACFACVVKVKADNADGWAYARACKDGPVFDAQKVYLEK